MKAWWAQAAFLLAFSSARGLIENHPSKVPSLRKKSVYNLSVEQECSYSVGGARASSHNVSSPYAEKGTASVAISSDIKRYLHEIQFIDWTDVNQHMEALTASRGGYLKYSPKLSLPSEFATEQEKREFGYRGMRLNIDGLIAALSRGMPVHKTAYARSHWGRAASAAYFALVPPMRTNPIEPTNDFNFYIFSLDKTMLGPPGSDIPAHAIREVFVFDRNKATFVRLPIESFVQNE